MVLEDREFNCEKRLIFLLKGRMSHRWIIVYQPQESGRGWVDMDAAPSDKQDCDQQQSRLRHGGRQSYTKQHSSFAQLSGSERLRRTKMRTMNFRMLHGGEDCDMRFS